ncbi:MAG: Trm112 family protein [Candidatus Hadarchaeum sp.]
MAKEIISSKLLEILACPVCKDRVGLEGEELVCAKCRRRYRIINGIPNMIAWDEKFG